MNVAVTFDNKWEITLMGFHRQDSIYWGSNRYQAMGTFVSFIVRIKNLQPGTDYFANRFTWWADDGNGAPKRYGTAVLPEGAAQYNYCGCGNSFDVLQPGKDTVGTVTFDVTKGSTTPLLIVAVRAGVNGTTDLRLEPPFIPVNK